jgi:hypothetical protein
MPILGFYPNRETLAVLAPVKLWRTKKKPRSCGMIQLKIGSLLKLSGKIKYFDIPNRNLKWEKEVYLWASSDL